MFVTRHELKTILGDLGLRQADLARLVDVTARAVNLWMTGERSVPGPVAAYLQLLASLPTAIRQIELLKFDKEAKTMREGMYQIDFAGEAGIGCGILVFTGGIVYGADTGKATYDG